MRQTPSRIAALNPRASGQPACAGQNEDIKLSFSPNSLRVGYCVTATANGQAVIKLDSAFELPHAIEPEFIPLADASCSKLFELLVSTPLQTGIRAFLQRRFDELRLQKAETKDENRTWQAAVRSSQAAVKAEEDEARAATLKKMQESDGSQNAIQTKT